MRVPECEALLEFLKRRDALIDALAIGQLSKRRFLESNASLLRECGIHPFSVAHSYEEALFNYLFYNNRAKQELQEMERCHTRYGDSRHYTFHLERRDNYYREKDKALRAILSFVEDDAIEAYPIHLSSRRLNCEIFEVVLHDREKAIFHSKCSTIREALEMRGRFCREPRNSAIASYVNAPIGVR